MRLLFRAYIEHMEVYLAARFGEFVAGPEMLHAEHRDEDFLYVKIESRLEKLLYQQRAILYGLESARGVLPKVREVASRLEDLVLEPIQELRPLELGATPSDEEVRDSVPLVHVVL